MLTTPFDPCATGTSPPASDVRLAPPEPLDQFDPELAELRAITLAGLKAILANPDTPPREFRLTAAVALRFITAAERELRRATAPPSLPRAVPGRQPPPRPAAPSVKPVVDHAPAPSPSRDEFVHSPTILSAIGTLRPTPAAALACAAGSSLSRHSVMALLSGSSP